MRAFPTRDGAKVGNIGDTVNGNVVTFELDVEVGTALLLVVRLSSGTIFAATIVTSFFGWPVFDTTTIAGCVFNFVDCIVGIVDDCNWVDCGGSCDEDCGGGRGGTVDTTAFGGLAVAGKVVAVLT